MTEEEQLSEPFSIISTDEEDSIEVAKRRRNSSSRDSKTKKTEKTIPKKVVKKEKGTAARSKKNSSQNDVQSVIKPKVKEYMLSSNRPFVLNDLIIAFKSEVGKTQMQRIVNELLEEKLIYSKAYSKTTVYCAVQDLAEIDLDEINKLDSEIEAIKSEISALKDDFIKSSRMLESINKYPNDEILKEKIESLEKEVAKGNKKLGQIEKIAVKEEDMKEMDSFIKKLQLEIKKRKSILKHVTDSLCEGTGMSKKELFGEIGLE